MEIELRQRERASAEAKEHAERQAHLHLSRFGREVTRVVLLVREAPRPGADVHCQAIAIVNRVGATRVDARGADPLAAVELALQRLARAIGEELERMRAGTRPSPGPSHS